MSGGGIDYWAEDRARRKAIVAAAERGGRKCADCRHYAIPNRCVNPRARRVIDGDNVIVARSIACMWWGDWWESKEVVRGP